MNSLRELKDLIRLQRVSAMRCMHAMRHGHAMHPPERGEVNDTLSPILSAFLAAMACLVLMSSPHVMIASRT